MNRFVLSLDAPGATLEIVGGKAANLARLVRAGFPVPAGFLITTTAYGAFVQEDGLQTKILELSRSTSADDPASFERSFRAIRALFDARPFPATIAQAVRRSYRNLIRAVDDHSGGSADDVRATGDPPIGEIMVPQSGVGRRASGRTPESGFDPAESSPHNQWRLSVAVRSSATAEDLPEASFAGQQDTYLNVCGEEAVLEAVKRCWASLWNAGAMAYRARQAIDPATVGVAVVVQRMVPSDGAGILFTANPLTGDPDEVVINAAWGLGESVVGGRVTPDTIVTDKATGRVRRLEVGDKAVMTVPREGGVAEAPVDPELRLRPILSPEQVAELTRLGREIEAYFGAPQDIEWAIAGGRWYVLQTRPVTALPDAPSALRDGKPTAPGADDWPALGRGPAQPFDLWTHTNVGEVWPHPVTPLTWSGIPEALNNAARFSMPGLGRYLRRVQWTGRFYGRVYYNEGALAHLFSRKFGLPGSLIDAALGCRRSALGRRDDGKFHPGRILLALPFFLGTTVRQLTAGRKLEALFPRVDRWVADFSERNLDRLSDRELREELMVWRERAAHVLNLHNVVSSSAMMTFAQLEARVDRWCGRRGLAHDLITGLSGVYTAEMATALWQIARKLEALGLEAVVLDSSPQGALAQLRELPQARPILDMLEAFLRRHGHRCPLEGEWMHPRWTEAPEQVVEVLAGYLRAGERVNPMEMEDRQRRRREEAVASVEACLGFFRRKLFRLDLVRAQRTVRLRENGRHVLMKVMLPLCLGNRVYGRRWADRGWLRQPEDLFFLAVSEIDAIIESGDPAAAGLDPPVLVAERRQAFEYWSGVEPPEVLGPDGRPFMPSSGKEAHSPWLIAHRKGSLLRAKDEEASGTGTFPICSRSPKNPPQSPFKKGEAKFPPFVKGGQGGVAEQITPFGQIGNTPSGTVLHGIAASGGRARGAARRIDDPREAARLQSGDILIARATDTGWTPVFPLVGGLVLEVGGQLSHGAIVAREYGVPAVVNVHDARRRIRDGQIITVDGTAGRVYLEAE